VKLGDKILLHDLYDLGVATMSVTDINHGVREILLSRRHAGDIGNRALSRKELNGLIYSTLGKAWDMYASTIIAQDPDYIGHMRLYYPAKYKDKTYIISGEIDAYHIPTRTIVDFKLVSMGKAIRLENDSTDYTRQLNGYAWLMRDGYLDPECTQKVDYPVEKLKLSVTCRDYDVYQDRVDAINEIDIDLWNPDETKAIFMKQLKDIMDYSSYSDDDIPYCSAAMRWEAPVTYPVFKLTSKGTKAVKPRAMPNTNKFSSEIEARQFIENHADKNMLYYEKRGGSPVRCKDFCALSGTVCNYLDTRRELI